MTTPGTVLISGSRGSIGTALSVAFEVAGYSVLGVDVVPLSEDDHAIGNYVVADISTREGADTAIAALPDSGPLVLCNNAGIRDGLALADEILDDDWDRVLATNLTGAFLLSRRILPSMLAQNEGVIINIASTAGLRGGRAGAAYTASKFGLVGLTYNIAAAYGPQGIRCNAVCPGPTKRRTDVPEREASARALTMQHRAGRQSEERGEASGVAAVAVFLASPAASRINGVALPVDDGSLAY